MTKRSESKSAFCDVVCASSRDVGEVNSNMLEHEYASDGGVDEKLEKGYASVGDTQRAVFFPQM